MKMIIVRHGETEANRMGHYIGNVKISLNPTGRQQVADVAKRLADEPIDIIYSSDLLRAKETARAISVYHPKAKLVFESELRERNSGEYSGRPVAERNAAVKKSGQHFRDWTPHGGESLREMKARAGKWYALHRVIDAKKNIIIVSHGLFIYSLLEWAIEDGADVERPEFGLANAAVIILDVQLSGTAKVEHLNGTSHQ